MTKLPKESLREFNVRVDREYAKHVASAAKSTTKTAQKKREFKKRKADQKRTKQLVNEAKAAEDNELAPEKSMG